MYIISLCQHKYLESICHIHQDPLHVELIFGYQQFISEWPQRESFK